MTFAQLQSIAKFSTRLLFIFLIFFSFSLGAHAQSYGEFLDVSFTPQNPGPGAHISMTVKDVVDNLDQKQITWSLNGSVVKKGIGQKDFEFDLGPLGSVSTVTVTSDVLSKTIQIRPTDVDIIWESDGYAPPFYKGKVLRTYQGDLRLVAMPNFITSSGAQVDRSKLVYTWKNGGVLNTGASGYAKNMVLYPSSTISRPLTIEADVSSEDGAYTGSKEITVNEADPLVLLYEDHPLYGVEYNNALNDEQFTLSDKELKVTAEPFYFSTQYKNDSELKYSWSVDGNVSNNPQFNDSVVLRQEGDSPAQSKVSVEIDNTNQFLQTAAASFSAMFGAPTQNQ